MRKIIAVLFLVLVHGCGISSQQYATSTAVLGSDNRVIINAKAWPWSAVGRLTTRFGDDTHSFCTATLVGKSSIVTAAHCLNKNGQQAKDMTFFTEYAYGSFGQKARVIRELRGSDNPQNHWSGDWALLQLDRDLGSTYGVLRFLPREALPVYYSLVVDLPGFTQRPHQPETMSAHLGCRIRSQFGREGSRRVPFPEMEGTMSHDCDLQLGTSGAPLITWIGHQPFIAAIQSFHWRTKDGIRGNGAVPPNEVQKALKQFEASHSLGDGV